MSRLVLAVLAVFAMASVSRAAVADEKKATTLNGVLIDTKCGQGKDETAAAKHAKSCAVACAGAGYAVIVGDKMYKLDDNGNKLAKEYLTKDQNTTKVTVEGTLKEDGSVAVTAIKMQKSEG
jgi:hypothetical protein